MFSQRKPLKFVASVANNILNIFAYFSEIVSLDISCEASAKQTIHMKCQDLFSIEKKKKKNGMSPAINFAWCFNILRGRLKLFSVF